MGVSAEHSLKLQPFSGNVDDSMWVKHSRVWRKTPNKQTKTNLLSSNRIFWKLLKNNNKLIYQNKEKQLSSKHEWLIKNDLDSGKNIGCGFWFAHICVHRIEDGYSPMKAIVVLVLWLLLQSMRLTLTYEISYMVTGRNSNSWLGIFCLISWLKHSDGRVLL